MPPPRRRSLLVALHWGLGFVAAFGLLWAIAPPFVNSVWPDAWDPRIGRALPPDGSLLRFRTEGWGDTRYGPHGLQAADLRSPAPVKIAVWGDSFVQGAHVDDDEKFGARFRRRWGERMPAVTTVAVGYPGRNVTDSWFLMPRYAEFQDFRAHVVVITDLFELSPDGRTFLGPPRWEFVERRRDPPLPRLRRRLAGARLDFLWRPLHRLLVDHRNPIGGEPLRWGPGPAAPTTVSQRTWRDLEEVDPVAWDHVLDRLRARTDRPLLLLYAPRVPFLQDGRLLDEHPARPWAEDLARLCHSRDIDFTDLSAAFAAFHSRTGRLPIGFHNGQMGYGHWNSAGHDLVAEALVEWVAEQRLAAGE